MMLVKEVQMLLQPPFQSMYYMFESHDNLYVDVSVGLQCATLMIHIQTKWIVQYFLDHLTLQDSISKVMQLIWLQRCQETPSISSNLSTPFFSSFLLKYFQV